MAFLRQKSGLDLVIAAVVETAVYGRQFQQDKRLGEILFGQILAILGVESGMPSA